MRSLTRISFAFTLRCILRICLVLSITFCIQDLATNLDLRGLHLNSNNSVAMPTFEVVLSVGGGVHAALLCEFPVSLGAIRVDAGIQTTNIEFHCGQRHLVRSSAVRAAEIAATVGAHMQSGG